MKPRPQKNRKTSTTKTTTPSRRDQILADCGTLRIPVTADQLDAALKHAQDTGLSHLDFLHRLLADQAGLRRERSLQRRIKDAGLGDLKPLSEFDWNFNPAISRPQIETLAQADFVRRGQNLVFVGQSGLGKSRLIRNIGFAALRLVQGQVRHQRRITGRLDGGTGRPNRPRPHPLLCPLRFFDNR